MTVKNLVVLAGLACAGSAFANPGVVSPTALPAGLPVKHMYYDMATGQITEMGVSNRSDQVWGYGSSNYSGYYFVSDNGYGDGNMQGDVHWDEGVLNSDASIDTFEFTYWAGGATATHAATPCDGTQTGDLFMSFSDTYATCGGIATNVADFLITGLPMDSCSAYIFTIGIAPGSEVALTSGHQFGYNWSWDLTNGPLVSALGMYIVNDDPTNAPGAEDAWQSTGPTAAGCWYFGGVPFAQFHMTMYGTAAPTGCPADFDGDGTVDFFDYDAYVNCFEGIVCPPGKDADFDGDGTADFFDYDAFVVAFETPCP